MTLQEFFNELSRHPIWILAYFTLIPIAALLTGSVSKAEGHLDPWKRIYSILIYLASVPGVFAVTLTVYIFIFERRSILQTDIYTEILPIASMVVTLLLIRRNVNLDLIPGFDKLTGLITMIAAVFIFLWVLEKTRIWIVSFLPFWQGILIFIGLLMAVRWGWRRMARKP